MSKSKYLDLAGLTVYDGKIKEWIKSSVVDITEDAIRALFVTVAEGPADNEIWYTSSDGNIVTPYETYVFGASIVSNTYENGKGIITFNGPVTSIGERTFWDYFELTSVTIPNSVTTIGEAAFYRCGGLISITIPDSVTSVGVMTFAQCRSLASITIPYSMTIIGDSAFAGCSSLASIVFEGTMDEWNSIGKGESWNYDVPATYVQCSDGKILL